MEKDRDVLLRAHQDNMGDLDFLEVVDTLFEAANEAMRAAYFEHVPVATIEDWYRFEATIARHRQGAALT